MSKRKRRVLLLTVWLALLIAPLFAVLYRPPAKLSGDVETTSVSFVAKSPRRNRGIFASDTVLDLVVRDFTRIASEPPEAPVSIACPSPPCTLRFRRVILNSLNTSDPLRFDISIAETALFMKLERTQSRRDGICSVGFTRESDASCAGCSREGLETSKKRLKDRLKQSSDRVLLWVFPQLDRTSLELKNWRIEQDSKTVQAAEEEHHILLVNDSSIEFQYDRGSGIRKGKLLFTVFAANIPAEVSEGDTLAINHIKNAQLDNLSLTNDKSALNVSWTATAGSTLQKHHSYPIGNDNPRLISSMTADTPFANFLSLAISFGGLLGSIKAARELFEPTKPKES